LDLQKPPIVEVWVEFQCDPSPSKRRWDLDTANEFLKQFSDYFVHTEVLNEQEFQIATLPTGDRRLDAGEVRLNRVRVRDAEGTRWLQLGEDVLVYNIVKKAGAYPGFETLCKDAWEKFAAYVRHFQPTCVRKLRLHYLDRVEIPCSPGERIDLDEFFLVGVKFPDAPFGALSRFAIQLAPDSGHADDHVSLAFRSEQRSADAKVSRMVMDWEATSANVGSLSHDDIMDRLERAHARIRDCFQASFTPKGWALFDPIE